MYKNHVYFRYSLPQKKELPPYKITIVARSVLHKGNKCNSQVLLDECLYNV